VTAAASRAAAGSRAPATHGKLAELPSVALFLQRAQRINPGFRLTEENARPCRALRAPRRPAPRHELAAARTQLLSPQMLLGAPGATPFPSFTGGSGHARTQHTLRSPSPRAMTCSQKRAGSAPSPGIFVGGFTLDAAETIAADAPHEAIDVLEGLARSSTRVWCQ